MGKLFGTDGIRGIVGEDLTHELAMKIGEAAAYVLGGKKDSPNKTISFLFKILSVLSST